MTRWAVHALICTLLIAATSTSCFAQRVGLSFTGDGALAFFNVGVLKALEEEGIEVDMVSGSGVSAFIAALFATGRSSTEIAKYAQRFAQAIATRGISPDEYPSDAELWQLLIELFGPFDLDGTNWDALSIPLRLTGQDLQEGYLVVFKAGSIAYAVRAAISGSSTVEPFEISGKRIRQSQAGGVSVLRDSGSDVVIHVNVSKSLELADALGAKARDLEVALAISEERQRHEELVTLGPDDILIAPNLSGAMISDYHRLQEFMDAGYLEAKERFRLGGVARLSQPHRRKHGVAKEPIPNGSWTLSGIDVLQNRFVPRERILKDFPLKTGGTFAIRALVEAIDALRRTGYYKSIWVNPIVTGDKIELQLFVHESERKLPVEALDNVMKALSSSNIAERRRAAASLGGIWHGYDGSRLGSAVSALNYDWTIGNSLNAVFKDPDPVVRMRLIANLGNFSALGRRMLGKLVGSLQTDVDDTVRRTSVIAIARIALVVAGDAKDHEIELFDLALQVARNDPEMRDAEGTIRLSLGRMREHAALRAAGDVAAELTFEGGLPPELTHATRIQVNEKPLPVSVDPTRGTIRFLGNTGSGSIRPGLNLIGAGQFWLEERRLTPFRSPYVRSHAIVVAIDDYARINDSRRRGSTGYEPLKMMVDGARKLVDALEKQGFPRENITTLFDAAATSDAVEAALREFWPGGKYADTDRLIIYFGGHGDVYDGQPFMVTYDFDRARPTATTFQMNDLAERQARNLQPRHVLFALDACHSGLSTRLGESQLQEEARLRAFQRLAIIRRDTEGKARNLLVAGTGDQRALYKNGGIFTTALVAGLKGDADLNGDGVIQFEELLFSVRNRVSSEAATTGVRQDPDGRILDLYGTGRMLFVGHQ